MSSSLQLIQRHFRNLWRCLSASASRATAAARDTLASWDNVLHVLSCKTEHDIECSAYHCCETISEWIFKWPMQPRTPWKLFNNEIHFAAVALRTNSTFSLQISVSHKSCGSANQFTLEHVRSFVSFFCMPRRLILSGRLVCVCFASIQSTGLMKCACLGRVKWYNVRRLGAVNVKCLPTKFCIVRRRHCRWRKRCRSHHRIFGWLDAPEQKLRIISIIRTLSVTQSPKRILFGTKLAVHSCIQYPLGRECNVQNVQANERQTEWRTGKNKKLCTHLSSVESSCRLLQPVWGAGKGSAWKYLRTLKWKIDTI